MLIDGRGWPPKLIIEEAVFITTGKFANVSSLTEGVEKTTNKFFRELGFDVVKCRAT